MGYKSHISSLQVIMKVAELNQVSINPYLMEIWTLVPVDDVKEI